MHIAIWNAKAHINIDTRNGKITKTIAILNTKK